MKKNWTMRVAALMAILTLATSCFVGGTFAKYVRTGAGDDNARVAKFGVGITGTGDLFNTTYAKHDTSFGIAADSVVTSPTGDGKKLVAPGTDGNLAAFELTGIPEVAVRVSYTVNDFTLTNWAVGTEFYCPLIIKVGTTEFCGLDYTDADDFIADVKVAIEDTTYDYEANTDLSAQTADDLAIAWKWVFDDSKADYPAGQTDVKDTYLGDRAAAGAAATIALEVTCAVTQID